MKAAITRSGHEGLAAFVHIPKTAGTTLNSILDRLYSPDETREIMMRGMSLRRPRWAIIPKPLVSLSKISRLKSALNHRSTLRLIRGHFDMSLSTVLPADTSFFTLLRDPVERAISHYYHYRRRIEDPIHPLAMRSTLAEWVSRCDLVEMDNGQTRRLAGKMNVACGEVTVQMLDRAKANLEEQFAVVGLTERFEESLILLHRTFNWPLFSFVSQNVDIGSPTRTELGKKVLTVIEDCNRFDSDLYEFASALLENAVSTIDMASELARLRAAPEHSYPK